MIVDKILNIFELDNEAAIYRLARSITREDFGPYYDKEKIIEQVTSKNRRIVRSRAPRITIRSFTCFYLSRDDPTKTLFATIDPAQNPCVKIEFVYKADKPRYTFSH